MRESAGVSLKSSLSHTFLLDTRDDKMAATRGAYGKIYQEIAGLALDGDATFYKTETEGLWIVGVVRFYCYLPLP
jgi:outer membrane protein insertion porin family